MQVAAGHVPVDDQLETAGPVEHRRPIDGHLDLLAGPQRTFRHKTDLSLAHIDRFAHADIQYLSAPQAPIADVLAQGKAPAGILFLIICQEHVNSAVERKDYIIEGDKVFVKLPVGAMLVRRRL